MRFTEGLNNSSSRLRFLLVIIFLLVSATLILARWKAAVPEPVNATPVQSEQRLEAEIVTITPTGFEPGEIARPQGRFLLAIDNRSGLDEVEMYLERETGGRVNVPLSRRGKLAWREVIDLPAGAYVLRAGNDESWRCRITLTAR